MGLAGRGPARRVDSRAAAGQADGDQARASWRPWRSSGLAAALLVNVMPTLIFPWLLVYTTRLSVVAMLTLIVTHAVVTIAAAAWAYLSIIALRETLAALVPTRWLAVISPLVQGTLIVALGSALLLIPPSSGQITKRLSSEWRALSPPMWFLGVYEVMAGDVLRHAPRTGLTPRKRKSRHRGLGSLRPAPAAVCGAGAPGRDNLAADRVHWRSSRTGGTRGAFRPRGRCVPVVDVDGDRRGCHARGSGTRTDDASRVLFHARGGMAQQPASTDIAARARQASPPRWSRSPGSS